MKLLRLIVGTVLLSVSMAHAAETITVVNPQGPTHSGTAHLLAAVEQANKVQKKYKFVVEFKPGAFESIGLNELARAPQTKIATVTTAGIEGFARGLTKVDDLVPVFSQGDSCWPLIGLVDKNQGLDSYKHVKEIVVGGPAIGGATHLAALEIGKRFNKPVRYIVYKSNMDAFVNMVGDNSINFIFVPIKSYEDFKGKNPNLHMLAMSCPTRHPGAPNLKTLKEYGVETPYVWQHIVAHHQMNPAKVKELEAIFTAATKALGQDAIRELSEQHPPMFYGGNSADHWRQGLKLIFGLRTKFEKEIEASR